MQSDWCSDQYLCHCTFCVGQSLVYSLTGVVTSTSVTVRFVLARVWYMVRLV